MNGKIPVIIDCDPGHDDAMAILWALSANELDVRGITTVAGNRTLEQVTGNARQQICLKIKEIDDPQDERILLCDLGKDLGRIDPLLHRDHHIIVMSDAKTALAERCIRLWCISQRISIFRLQSGTAAFTILCHHSSPVSAFPASPAGKRSSVQRLG